VRRLGRRGSAGGAANPEVSWAPAGKDLTNSAPRCRSRQVLLFAHYVSKPPAPRCPSTWTFFVEFDAVHPDRRQILGTGAKLAAGGRLDGASRQGTGGSCSKHMASHYTSGIGADLFPGWTPSRRLLLDTGPPTDVTVLRHCSLVTTLAYMGLLGRDTGGGPGEQGNWAPAAHVGAVQGSAERQRGGPGRPLPRGGPIEGRGPPTARTWTGPSSSWRN